ELIIQTVSKQVEAGADYIDVNAGLVGKEVQTMEWLLGLVQQSTELPIMLDCSDPVAMKKGLELVKTKPIVKPRSVVAYLCREHTNYSYSEIGHLLGGRHHTSIMATTKRVREQLETDEVLRHEIRDLVALILPIRPGEGR
ncbi:hypothetical protein LCGC14_1533230, partial [marine sediment metagenome]